MDIMVKLGEGTKVSAHFGDFVLHSDQAVTAGGTGSAPEPFGYFLTGLATCAGYFVQRFCQARDIPTDQIQIRMRNDWNAQKHAPDNFYFEIQVGEDFPDKYLDAVIRAVNECTVKKTILNQPNFAVTVRKAG